MTIAYVFPGQGSQSVGMLEDLRKDSTTIDERLDEASELLSFDLKAVVSAGPEAELNRTENTQPALLTVSVALYEMFLQEGGPMAQSMAGHSLGEYSALTAAGALDFGNAVELVRQRGRLMQEAVPEGQGSMAAVLGLDDDDVDRICSETEGVVAPANYNTPGQVVIAGEATAVSRASAACDEAGARRIVPLDVSVPSHCSLMNPAAEGLGSLLADIEIMQPKIPICQNVDAAFTTDPHKIRQNLIAQVNSPVLWSHSVVSMKNNGTTQFIECGPGKVLTSMMRRIDRSIEATSIGDRDSFVKALDQAT